MKKISKREALREAITLLQTKQAYDMAQLKGQFQVVKESLSPMNMVKSALSEVSSSQDIKGNILNNIIGMATGFFSKKIVFGKTHNPAKMALGALLEFAVANVVSKHSETIKLLGGKFLHYISGKLQKPDDGIGHGKPITT
jgi:hypothetical protein